MEYGTKRRTNLATHRRTRPLVPHHFARVQRGDVGAHESDFSGWALTPDRSLETCQVLMPNTFASACGVFVENKSTPASFKSFAFSTATGFVTSSVHASNLIPCLCNASAQLNPSRSDCASSVWSI